MTDTTARDRYWRDIGAPPPSPDERKQTRRQVEPEPFDFNEPPPHADVPEHMNGEPPVNEPPASPPLAFSDPAAWEGRDIPAREWLVHDWIPAAAVTLLSGDGAIGKTTLALQLAVAVKLGLPDWIGGLIDKPGPVIFFSAEEEEAEIWRRLDAICRSRERRLAELSGLHIFCMPDDDCAFAVPDPQGSMQQTALWRGFAAAIHNLRPTLVVLEAAADLFGGNEINRRQVSQFIRILRGPALATRASMLLLAHPSASGRNTGSGEAGSTQWHNSVRSRLYLTTPKADREAREQDAAPETDVRELRFMKSNYGPKGRPLQLQWERGVYVPLGSGSTIERAASEGAADDVFLRCLEARTAQGMDVSPLPGRNYAPTVFENMSEANGYKRRGLTQAQERLLSRGAIRVERRGPASRAKAVLVRVEGAA